MQQPNFHNDAVSVLPAEIKQFLAQVYRQGVADGRKAAKRNPKAVGLAYACGTHFLSAGGATPEAIRATYERLVAVLTPDNGFDASVRDRLAAAHRVLVGAGGVEGT